MNEELKKDYKYECCICKKIVNEEDMIEDEIKTIGHINKQEVIIKKTYKYWCSNCFEKKVLKK